MEYYSMNSFRNNRPDRLPCRLIGCHPLSKVHFKGGANRLNVIQATSQDQRSGVHGIGLGQAKPCFIHERDKV